MRETQAFFKLFPPPRFLTLPHSGLDISDDGIRCIRFDGSMRARRIGLYAKADFPEGLVDGGDIKDVKEFSARLAEFARLHGIVRVKVSIPEEKAYLFQTEVAGTDSRSITQNIEFKLEENVPIAAADALFYYELIPGEGPLRASVSVVPRSYIERYVGILAQAGMHPMAFEIDPRAIVRAVIPPGPGSAKIIVHLMRRSIGIHIVSDGAVCFTSTVSRTAMPELVSDAPAVEAGAVLSREVARVYAYWVSRDPGHPVGEIVLVGKDAASFEVVCRQLGGETELAVRLGNVWQNAFDLERYIPPVAREESFEYAVAAGLALDAVADL